MKFKTEYAPLRKKFSLEYVDTINEAICKLKTHDNYNNSGYYGCIGFTSKQGHETRLFHKSRHRPAGCAILNKVFIYRKPAEL